MIPRRNPSVTVDGVVHERGVMSVTRCELWWASRRRDILKKGRPRGKPCRDLVDCVACVAKGARDG